ncbi:DUF2975 domain-containing protein [Arthrobacter sp. H14]|uniref:DUF2975 domain-containing protein n=1 Tax=Arthrobacter sp. H14 TaxID=1312959 RepID=UPI0020A6B179|nr:DUF2975 domain-containing protein [Arthrobacter sp. H14]
MAITQWREAEMRRGTWFGLTAVLLVLLLLSVMVQAWLLPSAVESVTAVFPEVELLTVPGIMWGVLAIACWQAVAVIGLRLALLSRDGLFDASTDGWLRAMVGFLSAFVVLVVSAFIALSVMGYATPGVMLGLIGGGIIAVIAVGALVLFIANKPFMRISAHS